MDAVVAGSRPGGSVRWFGMLGALLMILPFQGCPDDPPDEPATTAPGDDDTTAPGDDDTTAPGDDDTTAPGDDDTTAPGDDDTTAPGDDDTTAPGDDDTTAPGDDDTTAPGDDDTTAPTPPTDADGDGATADRDCDDGDDQTYPGASEVCDEKDNDCDGLADDGAGESWYADGDGDGRRSETEWELACVAPEGTLPGTADVDCDDAAPQTYPGADELCDGADNDCDGALDEAALDASSFYLDADADGYGVTSEVVMSCQRPAGYAPEAGDCNDQLATVHPEGIEACDGVDNDCDQAIDEAGETVFYADTDGDGYGVSSATYTGCYAPAGYVSQAGDCLPNDATSYPGAVERCDGGPTGPLDNDCDGQVDEGAGSWWWPDQDVDGYGDPAGAMQSCSSLEGYVAAEEPKDCNDDEPLQHPEGTEICDQLDNDCDGEVDEGVLSSWYRDVDGDGHGDPKVVLSACEPDAGYVATAGDCEDRDGQVFPGNPEVCDSKDNDCDVAVDEEAGPWWYPDADGDGARADVSPIQSCSSPVGRLPSSAPIDCNDADATMTPEGTEICDGKDNDCDLLIDEEVGPLWYPDLDGDGARGETDAVQACSSPAEHLSVDASVDCDDQEPAAYPGNSEYCDGLDNDCDGQIDLPDPVDGVVYYADTDEDGFGDPNSMTRSCTGTPSGYVPTATDCNDASGTVYPGSGASCVAGESCLDVLEAGLAHGSDHYWIAPPSKVAYQEYCDFGTIGDGWAWRMPFWIDNPTASNLTSHQVPLTLDTSALVANGHLEADGADLRFATHDGPLLVYWIESGLGTSQTLIWVTVPLLPAGTRVDFTLFYGNPDTERKSVAWHYEDFTSNRAALYDTVYKPSADWTGTPKWTWNTSLSRLDSDTSNADYWLLLKSLELATPIYVELYGLIRDDDGMGPTLRGTDGSLTLAVACDNYCGTAAADGKEGIIRYSSVPTGHYQAARVLDAGNLYTVKNKLTRLGLYYDGSRLDYYLNGALKGSATATGLNFNAVGLASLANTELGAAYVASFYYFWAGSTPIAFNPLELSSSATSSFSAETSF